MAGKLVVEEGDLKGLSLSLEEGDTWTIGRDPDECQFLIEDPLVSRRHLLVRRTPEGITVENLSETNPALINDEEIDDKPRLLQNGDAVKIGNEMLRYYEDASAQIVEEPLPPEEAAEEAEEFEEFEAVEAHEPEATTPPAEESAPLSPYAPPPGHPYTQAPSVAETPQAPPPESPEESEEAPVQHTIFEEDESPDLGSLAEIDFGVVETGRWLLKVIGGPNNGAEFFMQTGNTYTLGTDPHSCDIVFHDTSVSRQHAKIIVTPEDTLMIEDLRSRNGVLINGALVEGRQPLSLSTIVTLGTTSFVIYDREGEMQTIISPLLPSIVKVLQQEAPKPQEAPPTEPVQPESAAAPPPEPQPAPPPPPKKHYGPYVVLAAIIGLFVLAGVGTTALFQSEPVVMHTQENADELIQLALKPYPAVRYTFNKANGGLLLLGHVSTLADKSQLLYNLQSLKFIKNIDDSGIVIDDYVWQEMNSILSKNRAWKGISIYSPSAGQFILSGYLQTRKEAEQLSSYINLNFAYLDLLKKQIIVEEDVVNQISSWLHQKQLSDVVPKMVNGEVTLTGAIPTEKASDLNEVIDKIKEIPGVRAVSNQVKSQTAETGMINISEHYQVTGKSRIGSKYTVVINGRILSENDDLDGMTIKRITPDRIFLEKDDVKYRIDY